MGSIFIGRLGGKEKKKEEELAQLQGLKDSRFIASKLETQMI